MEQLELHVDYTQVLGILTAVSLHLGFGVRGDSGY